MLPRCSSCLLLGAVVVLGGAGGSDEWFVQARPQPGGGGGEYWPSSTGDYHHYNKHQPPPPSYQPPRQGLPPYRYEDDEVMPDPRDSAIPPGSHRRPGIKGRRRSARAPSTGKGRHPEEEDYYYEDEEDEGKEEIQADLVDHYWRGIMGRLLVTTSAGTVGALLGAATSASLTGPPDTMLFGGVIVGLIICQFNNDFGHLFRALGLMLFLFIRRSVLTRSASPLMPQVFSAFRLGSRRPFPPSENPWNYRRVNPTDIEFDMPRSLMAVGLGGCFFGWSLGNMLGLFFFPPWILALAFGGFLAYTATFHDCRGDLARLLGMKLVGLVSVLRALDRELLVTPKLGRVFHISAAGMSRFDKRYKVREKMSSLAMFIYSKFNRATDQVKEDMTDAGMDPMNPNLFPSAPPFGYDDQQDYKKKRRGENPTGYDKRPPAYNPEYDYLGRR